MPAQTSIWLADCQPTIPSSAVPADRRAVWGTDVLVVGAGITGILAALRLAESGRRVTVVTALGGADRCGSARSDGHWTRWMGLHERRRCRRCRPLDHHGIRAESVGVRLGSAPYRPAGEPAQPGGIGSRGRRVFRRGPHSIPDRARGRHAPAWAVPCAPRGGPHHRVLPRSLWRAARGRCEVHSPRVPRAMERRGRELGLPVPRIALLGLRRRPRRPRPHSVAADRTVILAGAVVAERPPVSPCWPGVTRSGPAHTALERNAP